MRVSHLFGATLRETPAESETPSHTLLLRAGYVRQLASGIFSYLPLAQRSLRKIEQILREEMDRIGGQEINMPVVQPAEIWQKSGRWDTIGDELLRFQDRRESDMVLAMTHEEVVAALAHSEIESYRQLPQTVYQLQTKFRDEPRARGGLIRVREFVMKDSYSLDVDVEGLKTQYADHYDAYFRMMARAGLPVKAVRSDVGMMGGDVAHEFMYVTPVGEDALVLCSACDYAANQEVATFQKTAADHGAPADLEEVHTPGTQTIDDLADFLNIDPSDTAKCLFFMGTFPAEAGAEEATPTDTLILAVVRGDMDGNAIKIQNAAGAVDMRPAHDEEIRAVGAEPGYASPMDVERDDVVILVDDLVAESANLVTGANRVDYHVLNSNYDRDYEADFVGDLVEAPEGAPCPECGEPLTLSRGIEVGNIFQLGTKYTEALDATYTDADGERHPIVMGSYGIGVGRMLASAAEEHRDDYGLTLPITIAPFEVMLLTLGASDEVQSTANALYENLQDAGIEVLMDDRQESAGVKFNDADLRGIPLRLVVGSRSLDKGGVEAKHRTADNSEAEIIPLDDIVDWTCEEVDRLYDDVESRVDEVPTWEGGA